MPPTDEQTTLCPPNPEAAAVNQWRYDQLTAAGWPDLLAAMIAADPTIDLHHATSLLENGCDLHTAWEIIR